MFGPNFGGASVYTNTRAGYSLQCPNVGRLLRNLHVHHQGREPDDGLDSRSASAAAGCGRGVAQGQSGAARRLARGRLHASTVGRRSRRCGASTRSVAPGTSSTGSVNTRSRSATRVAVMIEYVKAHGRVVFDGVSMLIRGSVGGLTSLLRAVPAPLLMLALAALSWVLRRSLPLAAFVTAGAAVHHEPGLLAANARNALAGHRRRAGVDR